MTDIPKSTARQVVMQPVNCTSFLLGFVVLSATLRPFITIANRELLMVTGSKGGVEIKLDIKSNVLTGRKLAFGDAVKEKDVKVSGSKTSTGAKHSVGKCENRGRKNLSTNCYFRPRKPSPKVYFDGHIPFAADYGRPRKHPPKNN